MAKINIEDKGGIAARYVEAQEGIRIYLLPNVPIDAGEIPIEKGFDLERSLDVFPLEMRDRARRIGELYAGRQLDTMSILLYAKEQGKFDDYAKKLESKPRDFDYIHPNLMMARTDVSAFFMRLYADLGVAPQEDAEKAERQLRDYGIGVVVLPKGKKVKDFC
jgi:hypothetical protein